MPVEIFRIFNLCDLSNTAIDLLSYCEIASLMSTQQFSHIGYNNDYVQVELFS